MLKGLELIAIGKEKSFEVYYEGGKYFRADKKEEVEDLVDMACYACGSAYYTLDDDFVEFCPHCGHFERKQFATVQEIFAWSRHQNWEFLKYIPGYKPFAVLRQRSWSIRLGTSMERLEMTGAFTDVKAIVLKT